MEDKKNIHNSIFLMPNAKRPQEDIEINIEEFTGGQVGKELVNLLVMTAKDNGIKECIAVTPDSTLLQLKELIADLVDYYNQPVRYSLLTKEEAISKNVMSITVSGVTFHFVKATKFFTDDNRRF